MKKSFIIVCAVMSLAACNKKQESTSKETVAAPVEAVASKTSETDGKVKSLLVETETEMPGMGKTTMKTIFDDYGKVKLTETNTAISAGGHSINNNAKSLLKDGYLYSWSTIGKSGSKFKIDESGFDPKNLSNLTDEMRAKYNFKEEGSETVGGKECKVYSYSFEQMKGKVWIWKQVPLKSEINVGGKVYNTNFVRLEEDPAIPAGTFDLPAGIEFKEMSMPTTTR
jgi:hypothetical protein